MGTISAQDRAILANVRKRGSGGSSQQPIQFEDEGNPLGSAGTVTELDVTGSGATATRVGNKVTVNVPGSTATGTVTSVGLALPSIFSVSGTPVTTSGTFTAVLTNESANTVFAGPATGAAAPPTFRALSGADLPGGAGLKTPGVCFTSPSSSSPLFGVLIAEVSVPYTGTVIAWTIVGDVTGSATIDVYKSTYAAYDTMSLLFTASVTSAKKNNASGLSFAVTQGDVIRFQGSAFSNFSRCSIVLVVQ